MRRRIDTPSDLIILAKLFSPYSPLYITGGYVRNALMSLPSDDIDIVATLLPDKVIEILSNSKYRINTINARLGTIQIQADNRSYEYTAFRYDSYPKSSGIHKPVKVEFTNDIILDSKRRDFTINAIYYNILEEELIDNLGGVTDINNRIIRTTVNPDRVFSEDGLRIMRLIRFAAELNFAIDKDTYRAAKENVHLLNDIASERIIVELDKIFNSDSKYNLNPQAHYNGLVNLLNIGALDIIFPLLNINNLELLNLAEADLRLFVILIGNSTDVIVKQLKNRKFKKSLIREVSRLNNMVLLNINCRRDVIQIVIDNYDIIDKYIRLLKLYDKKNEYVKILNEINYIQDNNLPIKISRLKVKGEDLVKLNVAYCDRGKILRELLIQSIENGLNDRDSQMDKLKGDIL